MMHTIGFPHVRTRHVIAACCIAIAATCAYQAPGLLRAILVVGANAQLPLERLAADAASPTPVSAAFAPERSQTPVQKLENYGRTAPRKRHEHPAIRGYERSVNDHKYWT